MKNSNRNKYAIFYLALFLTFILISSCSKINSPKIERFIWIQTNLNWIWQPSDLMARNYFEYFDSLNTVIYSHSQIIKEDFKLVNKKTNYYELKAPDSLRQLITKFFYDKTFRTNYPNPYPIGTMTFDGDYYCIIYKFRNQPERIINYLPFSITDSLRFFTDYLEKFKPSEKSEIQVPFDNKRFIEKYRDIIIGDNHLAPQPIPYDPEVKYER